MARKSTPHMVIRDGRTGRKIGRNLTRNTLGNPKTRQNDMMALFAYYYDKGYERGVAAQKELVDLSTCHMEYGEGYVVTP